MSDLAPLRDWLAAWPDLAAGGPAWHAGKESTAPDGTSVHTFGWYDYDGAVDTFWSTLEAAGWDYPETRDYRDAVERWQAAHRAEPTDPAQFARLDRHTLFNVLRWYDRGERFCDGMWAAAWDRGVFQAAAQAVLALG